MEQQALKYLQIRHWNYWWNVYQCGTSIPACPNAVEFALTDDRAGSVPFFHFDFYTLPGLWEILREGSFLTPEDPDYPAFLRKAEDLQLGKIPYFIGGLYYRNFTPYLDFCNQSLSATHTLLDLRAPAVSPNYAVLFLSEVRPLIPEVLTTWMNRLSGTLFGSTFSTAIARTPTREEALAHWKKEQFEQF